MRLGGEIHNRVNVCSTRLEHSRLDGDVAFDKVMARQQLDEVVGFPAYVSVKADDFTIGPELKRQTHKSRTNEAMRRR